jgi:hypothetical protein
MVKRFNPDFSLSISHELAYMRETPEGGYVAYGDYATLFSELELVKADRDAVAVENAAQGAALSLISGCYGLSPHIQSMCAVETPATSVALAAIEARVWAEAKYFAKSMLASDSADCIDFLFDGKIQQLREAK